MTRYHIFLLITAICISSCATIDNKEFLIKGDTTVKTISIKGRITNIQYSPPPSYLQLIYSPPAKPGYLVELLKTGVITTVESDGSFKFVANYSKLKPGKHLISFTNREGNDFTAREGYSLIFQEFILPNTITLPFEIDLKDFAVEKLKTR